MKIRQGFVSNSSSSSFIVIGDNINRSNMNLGQLNYSMFDGESDFGWQEEIYTSIYDKLNWAILIQNAHSNYKNVHAIQDFIYEALLPYGITFLSNIDEIEALLESGNIDHQSFESENASMWDNHTKMAQWLLSSDSYIKNGNDNH